MMHFEVSGCERILMGDMIKQYSGQMLCLSGLYAQINIAQFHFHLHCLLAVSVGGDGHGQARMPVIGNGKYINILGACA